MNAPAETLARRSSRCPLCRARITAGEDAIRRIETGRLRGTWGHADCVGSYHAALAENAGAAK
jgi:hypothetical protein